jgi:hypothetical protein
LPKILKPDEEQFFINPPVFAARRNGTKRTTLSELHTHIGDLA